MLKWSVLQLDSGKTNVQFRYKDIMEDVETSAGASEHTEDEIDTRCRYISSCKPSFLQRFARPKAYLLVATLYSMLLGKHIHNVFI